MKRLLNDPAILFWLAAGLVVLTLLYLLSPILAPFLLAAILAYICNPLVNRLEQHGVRRILGVIVVMLGLAAIFTLLLLILLPLFVKETGLLIERLPAALDHLNTHFVPWLQGKFGLSLPLDATSLKAMAAGALQSGDGLATYLLNSLRIGGLALIAFIATVLLAPVVLFYLLRDWNAIVARIDHMVPRRWHARAGDLARQIDAVLAEFLRGQLAVIVVMSAYYVLALWAAGLEFSLPVGLVTGILVFVPYVGILIGLLLATLAALLQFPTLSDALPVWIAFAVGQGLEGMLITPWLVGHRIGLHPVAVIFALLAFGQIFGFFGVLLALPASAVLLVGLRHMHQRYLDSALYRD